MRKFVQTDKNSSLRIFVLSDTVGEISERLIYAVLSQFPDIHSKEIKKYPFIDNKNDLIKVLDDATNERAIVVTTLIDDELNTTAREYITEKGLYHIDYLSALMETISLKTELEPTYKSSALHALDEQYFDRMAAIEFAVKYDDGKNPKGFLKSDIVLLGISRTSKTPLSMYLANRSYKVSNLPLIPEVPVAKELFEVPSEKIFGLVASPEYIMTVRSERVKLMGLGTKSTYNDIERIKKELSYAEELFEEVGAHVISMENRSIEETAQQIELKINESFEHAASLNRQE